MNALDICVVSGGDEIRLRSYVNHAIYAREHGLDYRLECGVDTGIMNKFFYKTSIIRRVLGRYDWIAWIDDDAYFTNFERDTIGSLVAAAEGDGLFLVVANGPEEPNGFWSRINTGVVLLRNDVRSRQLLDLMHRASLDDVREWWDDSRDGLFTGGDQDQMWWALQYSELVNEARIVDHRELNSRGHFYDDSLSDAAVMHFCGHRDKPLGVARFADRFGVGHELVPEELLDKYSVRVRSPMSHLEQGIRAFRQELIGRLKPYVRPLVVQARVRKSRRRRSARE
ncbi:hypothetical protein [Brachybacterium tyrofermentans]|uniref:Galactosyl transferase GMA12/MNN10 family protein n=1 Tax=Brachybacterium tyrofermentans TaxID=47848 RepID=A0ABW0FG74_9MICO